MEEGQNDESIQKGFIDLKLPSSNNNPISSLPSTPSNLSPSTIDKEPTFTTSTLNDPKKSLTNHPYFIELLYYSPERLQQEPQILNEETIRLKKELEEAMTKHYTVYINARDCYEKIDNSLDKLKLAIEVI